MNRKAFFSIVLALAVLSLAVLPGFAASSFVSSAALIGSQHPVRRGPHFVTAGSVPRPDCMDSKCQSAVGSSSLTVTGLKAAAQNLPQWTQVNAAPNPSMSNVTALAQFKGKLFAATTQTDVNQPPLAVYRMSDDQRWEKVSPDGFGDVLNNQAIWDMVEFQGKLYVGTGWGYNWQTNDSNGYVSQIWRTSDGKTWEAVDKTGFGNPNNYLANKFTVYRGMIYTAIQQQDVNTAGGVVPAKGTQLYRSPSGDPGSWTKVNIVFSDPQNGYQDPTGFISYKGMLYMGLEGPAGLWRSKNGSDWEAVTKDGFGSPGSNEDGGLAMFKGQLYWGLANRAGGQIWRSQDGKNWSKVMDGGFGNPNNVKVEALISYAGDLFAMSDNVKEGLSVWRSKDGTHWQQANLYGFNGVCNLDQNGNGDCNLATTNGNDTVIFEDHLYVGVWNPAGGQIWRLNAGK